MGSALGKPALETFLSSARAWLTTATAKGCFKNPFALAALCQRDVFDQPLRLPPSSPPELGQKPTPTLWSLAWSGHTPAAPISPSHPPHPLCGDGHSSYGTCDVPVSPAVPGAAPPPCSPMAPGAIPACLPWLWQAWASASHPRHGRLPAAHRQEVAAEVEGWLFMLFFLYKSGRGWTIPDRTSCVCCALITGAARRTNTAAPRPEGERGHGAAPPPRVPWGWPRGAKMDGRQPCVPRDMGKERAPHLYLTTDIRWLLPPSSRLTDMGHVSASPSTATPHSPSEGLGGGPLGTPAAPGCPSQPMASMAGLAAIFSRECHVGICDPLKFGLQGSSQSGCWVPCHPCHTVPVLGKSEVRAVRATKHMT